MHDASFLADVDALIADMDGVLWRGSTWLDGVGRLLAHLQRHALPFVLATNNAGKAPEAYVRRFAARGLMVDRGQILTSALATAAHLSRRLPAAAPVYAVGGPGLRQALTDVGFVLVPDADTRADVVVVGIDFELTYEKLAHAALQIQRGARFVATNADPTYPSEAGALPGAGTIVRALETCSGVTPFVVGKPEPAMFEIARERLGMEASRILVLGDRLDTDVLGGLRAGMRTVLVTTGIDDEAAAARTGITPDLIVDGLPRLVELWDSALAAAAAT